MQSFDRIKIYSSSPAPLKKVINEKLVNHLSYSLIYLVKLIGTSLEIQVTDKVIIKIFHLKMFITSVRTK